MSEKRPGKTDAPAEPAKTTKKPDPNRISLPSSGLAAEILAHVDRAAAASAGSATSAASPALDGETAGGDSGAAASSFTGRESIYAFVDSLDSRATREAQLEERPESWVTFALSGEIYALPVSHVQEILRIATITRVPHAPVAVRGITNLRGRVLAVVDLRVRLGLAASEIGPESRILVADARGRSIGLLVDAARQVLKILPSAIQPPPADVLTERTDFLRGVHHLDRDLIILLDVERVLLIEDGRALLSI
jgi:purine-binding chemotaxis protein CheW